MYIYIYIHTHTLIHNNYFMLVLRVTCLTQSFNKRNKIYKHKYKKYTLWKPIYLTDYQSFLVISN